MRQIGKVLTVEEVNHKIPKLEKLIEKARDRKSKLEYYRPDLSDKDKLRITRRRSVDEKSAKRQLEFSDSIKELIDEGGMLKDIEEGLVDFRWRRKGKKVYLCWKYGEKEVLHWHDSRDGCLKRKPL
jgi:hypothetical protein